jgi:Galactose oxidase, central domain
LSSNYPPRDPDYDAPEGGDIRISRRAALAGAAGVVGVAAVAVVAILLRDDGNDDSNDSGSVVTATPESTAIPTSTLVPTNTPEPPLPTPTEAPTETPTLEPSPTAEPTVTETEVPATPTTAPTATATEPAPTPTVPPTAGWTRLEPEGDLPAGRRDHSLVADLAQDRVYLFGGRAGTEALAELWVYDLTSNLWEEINSDGDAPAARFGHNAVFDETQQLMVIFGGQAGPTFFSDVWVYDPVSNVWAQINPGDGDGTPRPRYGAAASARAGGSGLYVSHGFTNDGRYDDTWLFNVQTGRWSDVSPATGDRPEQRCLVRMATDPDRERLLLFGGQSNNSPYLGDLWAYDTADRSWSEIETNNPPARNLYSLVRNPVTGNLILFGGASKDGLRGDIWIFDVEEDSWSAEVIDPNISELIPPRDSHDAVWLEDAAVMLMFGGRDDSGMLNDLWIYAP